MENNIFDKKVLSYSMEDLNMDINELLNDVAPAGKTNKDFTGGYIQQLKNSNQMVAYFGTKAGTKNRDTVKITISADELDLFYMMLKVKIHEMKNETTKTIAVSMAARKLAKINKDESQEETYSEAVISPASNEDSDAPEGF